MPLHPIPSHAADTYVWDGSGRSQARGGISFGGVNKKKFLADWKMREGAEVLGGGIGNHHARRYKKLILSICFEFGYLSKCGLL